MRSIGFVVGSIGFELQHKVEPLSDTHRAQDLLSQLQQVRVSRRILGLSRLLK